MDPSSQTNLALLSVHIDWKPTIISPLRWLIVHVLAFIENPQSKKLAALTSTSGQIGRTMISV